jgi:hypothetical protein
MTHDHDGWRKFGLRNLPPFSGRTRMELPEPFSFLVDERRPGMTDPFVGITVDGEVRRGLRTLDGARVSTSAITDAALALLQALTPFPRPSLSSRASSERPEETEGVLVRAIGGGSGVRR